MIDGAALLRDLKVQLRLLEDDLRQRSADVSEFDETLHLEWEDARRSNRTASTYEAWLDDRVTQLAVAWILATVFIRFCEDNGLIDLPVLSGRGDRLAIASERQQEFFAEHPAMTDRDWILQGVEALLVSKAAAGVFDEAHNPMWTVNPSHEAAKDLLAFWRYRGEDGEIVHDFKDPKWNTRFLGDLYQDLSEDAKKTYALLQTPEFVEEFILDYTLDPAIEEFGLTPDPPEQRPDLPHLLRVIDPTCGSGHFLLGAFHRLLAQWEKKAPDADRWEQISRALSSVHGVDKNPFAAAIARFRLVIAAMKAADEKRLADAPEFPVNVAVGDSLLHGRGAPGIQVEFDLLNHSGSRTHAYVTEDILDYSKSVDMLGVGSYHVVVGNPPYITVKDKQENKIYRIAYPSCYRNYSLAVPFAERFFQLAVTGSRSGGSAGYVAQITANSFMDREFGKKLVEQFFPKIDLTYVIDSSDVFLPGFGTPTVILIGRRRWPRKESTVRVALSLRSQAGEPDIPSEGLVWLAIKNQIDKPGTLSEWINVVDMERDQLRFHPWNLGNREATQLQASIESAGNRRLGEIVASIGRTTATGEDDLYFLLDDQTAWRLRERNFVRDLVVGDAVRDFQLRDFVKVRNPYTDNTNSQSIPDSHPLASKGLWVARTGLRNRMIFGKTISEYGRPWTVHLENYSRKLKNRFSITFAFVATHNHFVFDREGRLFNRTAPVIKLPREATEEDHLALLAVLNTSLACFWLKQVSHDKGNRGGERSTGRYAWESFFEFTGATLEKFPLPGELPVAFGVELDKLVGRLNAAEPLAICVEEVPTRMSLDMARVASENIRGRIMALQEELDWDAYRRYGLIGDTEGAEVIADPAIVPELQLGERAFEILLASRGQEPEWFERHRSTPIAEIPAHWPEAYKAVVAKRIKMIENRHDIALIERPECKRRWQSEPWDNKERAALTSWLLDRCEGRELWVAADEWGREQPRPVTVNRLADRLRGNADLVSVARLLDGPDADLADVLTSIIADQYVPYLAQLRYTATGVGKRAQWEQTWDKQREEDAKDIRLDIAVPPKYKKEDFTRASYWNQRGKLDVPKERFISYVLASPDGDDSLLLGWAGWDHREQAHALMTLIEERSTKDGWGVKKLTPLIAGLAEVMPWVRQWHADTDPAYGMSPAEAYNAYLEDQRVKYGLSEQDLRKWSPPSVERRRGRRKGPGKASPADNSARPGTDDQNEGA